MSVFCVAKKVSNHTNVFNDPIQISVETGQNIPLLEKKIEEKINQIFETIDSPFLLNQRQFQLLLGLENKLINILDQLNAPIQYEIISYLIKDSLEHITELTGKSISEASMDAIFKEFCVGK